ncbi:hypothetical protein M5585_16270 [Serratia ureilytica]
MRGDVSAIPIRGGDRTGGEIGGKGGGKGQARATLRAIVFNKPADIDDPFSDVQLSGEFN